MEKLCICNGEIGQGCRCGTASLWKLQTLAYVCRFGQIGSSVRTGAGGGRLRVGRCAGKKRAGRLRLAWSLCRFYPLWGYEFKKKGEEGNEHISGKLWKFIFEISGDQF